MKKLARLISQFPPGVEQNVAAALELARDDIRRAYLGGVA
jgi:hypothetical protein